jgi:putrescine---pyruvate transaminase
MSVAAFCEREGAGPGSQDPRTGRRSKVGAFIAEPIQASGGVIVPPEGYLRRCWELCRKYDVLFIADEVVTGFGRLGHWFASKDVFGIEPDMITCAKGLSSGYVPLGALPRFPADHLFREVSGEQCARRELSARLYLLRASGVLRRGPQEHRDHRARRIARARARGRSAFSQQRLHELRDHPDGL